MINKNINYMQRIKCNMFSRALLQNGEDAYTLWARSKELSEV